MKKISKFIYALALLPFLAVSCDLAQFPEDNNYEPGQPDMEGCYGVYFPAQDFSSYAQMDPQDPTCVDITVARANSSGEIDVPVKIISQTSEIFSITPIHFADGQTETIATLSFPSAGVGVKYSCTLEVSDPQYASIYGNNPTFIDFSFNRIKWNYLGKGRWRDDFLGSFWSVGDLYPESEPDIYERDDKKGYYMVKTPYNPAILAPYFEVDPSELEEYKGIYWDDVDFIIDATDPDCVMIPEQSIGGTLNSGYGMLIVTSMYKGEPFTKGTLKDKVITFPKEGMLMVVNGEGYYYGNSAGMFRVCLPGAVLTDYSLKLKADYTQDGILPVYFTAGADVAAVKYAALEGELEDADIADAAKEIISGTLKSKDLDMNLMAAGLTFEKTGTYTIVAVSFDESSTAQEIASVAAKYIAAEDAGDYAVDLEIGVEAVPERYHVDPYTTMAFYIAGKDLKDVHFATVEYSKFVQAPSEYAAALAESKDLAVSAGDLAKINSKGGWYSYIEKLKPNTSYVFIVWGTNGNLDKVVAEGYITPRLPYVWNSLGTGLFTDDTVGPIYEMDPATVEVEVFQEASDPGLYKFKGHALKLACAYFGADENALAAYEGIIWDDVEIVLDATDPQNVIWEEQDFGVCLNSGDGFFTVTNMYDGKPFSKGVLKDGVISYPTAQGMLCTIGGDGYYYANLNGKTQLVLPSAVATSSASVTETVVNAKSVDSMKPAFRGVVAAKKGKIAIKRDIVPASFTVSPVAPSHQKRNGELSVCGKKADL